MVAKVECITCPLHDQFEKRLDQRWEAHVERQDKINEELFKDLKEQRDMNNKFLGGLALLTMVMSILGPKIANWMFK